MNSIERYKKVYGTKNESMSLAEYLKLCKTDSSYYINAAERMLKAIGEPEMVDTSQDPELNRLFYGRTIKRYPAFKDFYGMETVVENIISYFIHSSQNLEEKKQILYLLGPVGGGKSSLSKKLKQLMESQPFYAIENSPIFESPLGLFSEEDSEELQIPGRYLTGKISPWLEKRLSELGGDITQLRVVKLYPSEARQIAIAKTEPGDDNNQDISALVGKIDIRKLEQYSQDDPDAYKYNGGLCLGNRGILEFVEMFKAPIKVLNPLLEATQDGTYKATEALPAIPFDGIILSHSNESEWESFRENKNNEAFLDRVYIVKVPYCLRYSEEIKIYKKLLANSSLHSAPVAPETLDILAKFCILTRLEGKDRAVLVKKLQIYNGDNLKNKGLSAEEIQGYREMATVNEGFEGVSTRTAFKIISKVFNANLTEIAADPIDMMSAISQYLKLEDLPKKDEWEKYISGYLKPEYATKLNKEITTAFTSQYNEYGQHVFDKYILYAEYWLDESSCKDPSTGEILNRDALDERLCDIEEKAEIANKKDFRNDIVNVSLKYRARHKGKNPDWKAYEKIKEVIEKKINIKMEEMLPIISTSVQTSKDDKVKYDNFMKRMMERGYTQKQVEKLSQWFKTCKLGG